MLHVPKLQVRNLSYKGYPISIITMGSLTTVYELAGDTRIIESGSQLMYVANGNAVVITPDSMIYKELIYRILNSIVLEDGNYNYEARH